MNTQNTADKPYDYNTIPLGFYDEISIKNKGMRSFWHNLKFDRVVDCIPQNSGKILDIGCFSGTFLGRVSEEKFNQQIGVDILSEQVAYANSKYGNDFRKFYTYSTPNDLLEWGENEFDFITIIEVIEHLTTSEIVNLLEIVTRILKPGGSLIITTPNYTSFWPILEFGLNKISSIEYDDQHITKFGFYSFENKINQIIPQFNTHFKKEFITSTHFLSPYIAIISNSIAIKISKMTPHNKWQFPFGSLILTKFTKK